VSDEHDEHDELRARLRAADPAASLPRSDPDRVARLLEETMSHTVTTEPRTDDVRHRSPLTWLVAAAAVAIIAGVGVFVVMNGSEDPGAPVAGADPTSSSTGEDSVTELRAPGAGATAGRCLPVTAPALGGATVAFDGTVEEIEGGLVTLRATDWYAGDPTDLVTVRAPSEDLQALLAAVDFQDGGRYLVAATGDERLMVCGFSAPYSRGLAAVYERAFGS
jgi:hypothetical protein